MSEVKIDPDVPLNLKETSSSVEIQNMFIDSPVHTLHTKIKVELEPWDEAVIQEKSNTPEAKFASKSFKNNMYINNISNTSNWSKKNQVEIKSEKVYFTPEPIHSQNQVFIKTEHVEEQYGYIVQLEQQNLNVHKEFEPKKKKKQKLNDGQSAGCSKRFGTCAQYLLDGTQFTDLSQSAQSMQDIDDIDIEANNYHQKSNSRRRVDKKAAQRSQLYRQRHREEINQRRREMRQSSRQIHTLSNIQYKNEIEQMTHATSNKLRSNSHKQRQQRYYERHKEEINKRKRDNRLKKNNSQSIPATAAERNRKYRERNKQRINERRRNSRRLQQNIQRHTECNINNIDVNEEIVGAKPDNQQNYISLNYVKQDEAQNSISTLQENKNKKT